MLHAPVLWRPEPDYCTRIQPQSVFIRERAKIIQEGSGPLIHLKRRMTGGDFRGGGAERAVVGYFERGEPCGSTMRALVNKCPVDYLNLILLFPPVLSLRSAANFPAIWDKLFVKSLLIPPLGIHSQKIENGGVGWMDNCSENGNNVWRICLMTSSASSFRLVLFIQTIITCHRNRF